MALNFIFKIWQKCSLEERVEVLPMDKEFASFGRTELCQLVQSRVAVSLSRHAL